MPVPHKNSLYLTAAVIILLSVVTAMGTHSALQYQMTKERLLEDIRDRAKVSIEALKLNIASLMEAYAVNEYNNLVLAELERRDAQAIVVEDYNMGQITGQKAYISGKLRRDDDTVVDYNVENTQHRKLLDSCFYKAYTAIAATNGKPLGMLTVCISDDTVRKELKGIISDVVYNIIIVTLTLVVLLFAALHRYLLKPISGIIKVLGNTDESGLPSEAIPEYKVMELNILSETMNKMLASIRESQEELKKSELRWKFAVEGSGDGLWDWDLVHNSVFYSTQWKRMLGFEEDEISMNLEEWSQRVHPDDLDAAFEDIKRHLDGESDVYINQHRILAKNGKYIWILDRGIVVERDDEGKPLRMIGTHTDITEQVRHEEELRHSATHDSLTGLPNRFMFSELIQHALHRSVRNNTFLALLYIDLDSFKQVNDVYGHDAGDKLLITMAERMKRLIRQEDVVARLGGDEFAIAISDLDKNTDLLPLLERLMHELSRPVLHRHHGDHELQVSASIGVTFYPQENEIGPEALLRQADHAMYEAKGAGKNQFCFYNIDASESLREEQRVATELHRAIDQNELLLHYQPKLDMAAGQVVGFEALLRWQHPQEGLLYPDAFLPQINRHSELMLELGKWVLEHAIQQLASWHRNGLHYSISINISTHELKSDETTALLKSLLRRYPELDPSLIELELLETHVLDDINNAREVIDTWRELGIGVALDDFGTGYSTLGYLKNLTVDTLKIDKSFVIDMLYDNASFSILEASMGLARAFRCNIVAEGVESVEHGVLLMQLGCRVAQGYAIARPMPADAIQAWLDTYIPPQSWQGVHPLHHKDWTILYAIVEHRHWRRMLDKHLDAPFDSPMPEMDSRRCRFGEWLETEASGFTDNVRLLEELNAQHHQLHRIARQLADAALQKSIPNEKREALMQLHSDLLNKLQLLIDNPRATATDRSSQGSVA